MCVPVDGAHNLRAQVCVLASRINLSLSIGQGRQGDAKPRRPARPTRLVQIASPPFGLEGALVLHVSCVPVHHRPVMPAHEPHQVALGPAVGQPVIRESVSVMWNST
jgi:hypothetical protein